VPCVLGNSHWFFNFAQSLITSSFDKFSCDS
jgi:hypothetical protein